MSAEKIFLKAWNAIPKRKILKIVLDIGIIAAAYYAAYLIRFEGKLPELYEVMVARTMPFLFVYWIVFFFLKMYHGKWEYAGIRDLITMTYGHLLGLVVFITLLHFLNYRHIPRSVLIVFTLLAFLATGGLRLLYRIVLELSNLSRGDRQRVLIIGAGDAGEMIIRQIKNDKSLGYFPVGIIDDDPKKVGLRIHGVPVLGNSAALPTITENKRVDEIIIATPAATTVQMRKIVDACEKTNIEFRTVPGLREILNGTVSVSQLRKVKIEDLLGREPVHIDFAQVADFLRGKSVMVTGAAGSIGSELCRQILRFKPGQLILYDRAENNLFYLDYELNGNSEAKRFKTVIGDITDVEKTKKVMRAVSPDVIFHAAAFKHVPLMEQHPEEAIKNNVMGTINVALLAEQCNVEKFVLISTDKAVNPTSIMGASKKLAELYVQALYEHSGKTKFITVRFGNVIASDGSVVTLFQRQIKRGGPVTITDPQMTRYFMTIEEAVQLILQSSAMGTGGEIFILDMGEPIRVEALARHLITLSGYKPGKDIEIKVIGLRPGEKLNEELWNGNEQAVRTTNKKILAAQSGHCDWITLNSKIYELQKISQMMKKELIVKNIKDIIPEYNPAAKV